MKYILICNDCGKELCYRDNKYVYKCPKEGCDGDLEKINTDPDGDDQQQDDDDNNDDENNFSESINEAESSLKRFADKLDSIMDEELNKEYPSLSIDPRNISFGAPISDRPSIIDPVESAKRELASITGLSSLCNKNTDISEIFIALSECDIISSQTIKMWVPSHEIEAEMVCSDCPIPYAPYTNKNKFGDREPICLKGPLDYNVTIRSEKDLPKLRCPGCNKIPVIT